MKRQPSSTLIRFTAILASALLMVGCSGQGDEMSESSNPQLPSVSGAYGEEPSITVPDIDPPSTLESADLTVGTGASVEATSTLTVNYSLVTWSDKAAIESSFSSAPATFPLSGVIRGWQQ